MKTLALILLPLFSFCQVKILKWSDFRMKPPVPESVAAARSNLAMVWSWDEYAGGDSVSDFSCTPEFNPDSSFTNTRSLWVLKHEQMHYFILHMACHEANRDASRHHKISFQQMAEIQSFYEQAWSYVDNEYDLQTKHSLDSVMQTEWNEKLIKQVKTIKP